MSSHLPPLSDRINFPHIRVRSMELERRTLAYTMGAQSFTPEELDQAIIEAMEDPSLSTNLRGRIITRYKELHRAATAKRNRRVPQSL